MQIAQGPITHDALWEIHTYSVEHEERAHTVVIRVDLTYRWIWLLEVNGVKMGTCDGVGDGLSRARRAIIAGTIDRLSA